MTLAVHHIAINACDPLALAATYRTIGFRSVEGGGADWLAAPNAYIAVRASRQRLPESAVARRSCDAGIAHICVQSGNGDGLWHMLRDAGVVFNAAPVALGTGATYAYGRDSEHNLIEVEGVDDVATDVLPWIAHVALVTNDLDRLADFYTRLIGRAPHDGGHFRNAAFEVITGLSNVDVRALWLMTDNMILELWQYLEPPTLPTSPRDDDAPGYRHIGFACADLAAERLRLEQAGIVIEAEADRLFGRDPDGNLFVLFAASDRFALTELSDPDRVTDRHRHLLAR